MAIELTPQGAVPAIGIPNSQDTARLVFSAPYFDTVPIAEIILPSVEEAVQAILPSLVPPYVDQAAQAAVQQSAVLLTGSTMSGPLNLSPLLPVSDSMAATKAYVDTMVATAGVPEVPAVPVGQSWVRQVGQWAPLSDDPGGPFLQLSGGSMQGQINMSGNAILNLPAVPVMPNGAAPATWVLNQIAAVSLYQGTWNLDTFTPDLTQPSTHINGYTWIAITNAPAGVVISPAVPGLQGMTVYNGDQVIFSAAQGNFSAIHAGGLTAPQADARYLMLVGGQLSGALLLNSNASQPLQAVTLQQLQAFVPPGIVPEAPGDGQLYGRNGLTHAWTAVLPLAGGVMSGALSLSGNASANLHAVPFQQLNTAIATAVSGYVPITGTTMTGLLTLSGNAGSNLNPVPLQQLNAMLGTYAPLNNPVLTGDPRAPTPATSDNDTSIATTAYVKAQGYLPMAAGSGNPLTGPLLVSAGVTSFSNGFNTYFNGTNWIRVAAAPAGVFTFDTAAQQFNFFVTPTGAAGSTATMTGVGNLNNNGILTLVPPSSSDPLRLTVASGQNARITATVTGSRAWTFGTASFSQWVLSDDTAGANRIQIATDGGCFCTTGTWQSLSDGRLKRDVTDYGHGLAEIVQLRPVQFYYSEPALDTGELHFGLIAQDVEAVLPELVSTMPGPIRAPQIDENGQAVPQDETLWKTVDPGRLIYSLLNAVKELAVKVDALTPA